MPERIYTEEELRDIAKAARQSKQFGELYQSMSDYEVLNDARSRFNAFRDIPNELPMGVLEDHLRRKKADTEDWEVADIRANETHDYDGIDGEQTVRQKGTFDNIDSGWDFWKGYFALGYLPVPEYFKNAFKRGANESITGLAGHIITGEAPFDIDEFMSKEEGGDLFQGALSLAAGMAYDWWFMLGTNGVGASVHFAGSVAKKQAAKEIAEIMFRKGLVADKIITEKLGAKVVEKAVRGQTAEKAGARIIAAGKKAGWEGAETYVDDVLKEAHKSSVRHVKAASLSDDFVTGGLKKYEGKALKNQIDAPLVRSVVAQSGFRAAEALGAYSGVMNFETQFLNNIVGVNPETGVAFTDAEKGGLLDAWKRGELGETASEAFFEVDPAQVLYSAMSGYFGGFVAGGVGGVMKAGGAGAFRKADWNLNNAGAEKISEEMFTSFVGKGAGVLTEGTAFALSGLLADNTLAPILGVEPPEQTWGERWLHSVVTVGTLKGLHGTFDTLKKQSNKLETSLKRAAIERHKKELESIERAKNELDPDTPSGKLARKTLEERQAKVEEKLAKSGDLGVVTELFARARELAEKMPLMSGIRDGRIISKRGGYDKEGQTKITINEFNELVDILGKIQNLSSKYLNSNNATPELLKLIGNDPLLIKIFEAIKTEDGKHGPILNQALKEIAESEKRAIELEKQTGTKPGKDEKIVRDPIQEIVEKYEGRESVPKEHPEADTSKKPVIFGENKEPLYPRKAKKIEPIDEVADQYKPSRTEQGQKVDKKLQVKPTDNESVNQITEKLKKIVAVKESQDVKSLDSSTPLHSINQFAKWFYKKTGFSLNQATKDDLTEYLNVGGKGGKPFAIGKTGVQQEHSNIRRWVRILQDHVPSLREGELLQSKRPKPTKGDPTKESKLEVDTGEGLNPTQVKSFKTRISKIAQDGKDIMVKGVGKVSSDVIHSVNYILGLYGKRQTAIHGEGKDSVPIRIGDLGDIVTVGGKKAYVIDVWDKGGGSKKPTMIVVPDVAINGVNYFKILKRLAARRMKETGKDTDAPLFAKKDGSALEAGQLVDIMSYSLGQLSLPKGFSTHGFRDTMGNIAERIDTALNTGSNYFNAVFRKLVQHKQTGTSREFYWEAKPEEAMDLVIKLHKMDADLTKLGIKRFQKKYKNEMGKDDASQYQKYRAEGNQLTERSPLTHEALSGQIDELFYSATGKKKYPSHKGLRLEEDQGQDYAGRISSGIIRLVRGKADETTVFHELTHLLYDTVVKQGKGPQGKELRRLWREGKEKVSEWARENDPDRWEAFLRDYGDKAEHEYMTQLSGEWALEKFNARTKVGKFGNWIREFMSAVKNYFGIGTPEDIARVYGKMVDKGFSTEGYKEAMSHYQKMASKSKGKPATPEQIKDLDDLTTLRGFDPAMYVRVLDHLGLVSAKTGKPLRGIEVKEGKLVGLTEAQANALIGFINEFVPKAGKIKGVGKADKDWHKLNQIAHMEVRARGITTEMEQLIKQTLGIPKQSLEFATKTQLRKFITAIEEFGKTYSADSVLHERMIIEASKNSGSLNRLYERFGRYAFITSAVLKKFGGKRLHKLGLDLEKHYLAENKEVGTGMVYINSATHEIGAKKMKFIPFALDESLSAPFDVGGGKMKQPNMHKIRGYTEFMDNYLRGKKDMANGGKGTKESRAVKHIEDMYDYYWKKLEYVAKEQIKNPRMFEEWQQKMNRKYVEGYFTHILTPEAKEYFQKGNEGGHGKALKALAQDIIKIKTKDSRDRISKLEYLVDTLPEGQQKAKSVEMLKKERSEQAKFLRDAHKEGTEEFKKVWHRASIQLAHILRPEYNNVQNKYLLSRNPDIGGYIMGAKGKPIKVWETSFDKVAGQYIRVMSKYIATGQIFPEFTNMKGEYASASAASMAILESLGRDGGELGTYTQKLLKRRIGLEGVEIEHQWLTSLLSQASKYSALFGLSSFMSGIKNAAIGTTMTIGVHGMVPFTHGLIKAMNPKSWKEARERGWFEIGTKDLEITGLGDKWMTWGSWMKPTEQINRVVGGFAGEYAARQLTNRLRGKSLMSSMLGKRITKNIASKELMNRFRITEKEMIDLENYGLDASNIPATATKKSAARIMAWQEAMIEKIQQYGHIISQGATGDPFLPLWAGNPNAKAMTLFYRMAYSSTSNIWQYVVKPLKHGNALPLIRHTMAGNVTGAALWAIYEKLLGQDPPKVNENELAQLGQNLAKVEALALWSFILNPYAAAKEGLSSLLINDSIMQPALIRNIGLGMGWAMNTVFGDGKVDIVSNTNDMFKNLIVMVNHADKIATNVQNAYKTDMRNLNTHKNAWMKQSGIWEEEQRTRNPFSYKYSQNAQYHRLIREAFLNNDLEAAARYYVATWYQYYDGYRTIGDREHRFHDEAYKQTENRLKQVLDNINPLGFADSEGRQAWDKRNEFLAYLTPDRKAKALKLEKSYKYKRRKLGKEIGKLWKRHGGMYKRGKIEELFPLPPMKKWLGITDFGKTKPKWKESERKKYLGY